MSVCGQIEEESASEDGGAGGGGAPVREMYEQKAVSTVVRVLTVLAYLLSVSLAAILLSVYYVCVWQSPKLPPLDESGGGQLSALRAEPDHPDLNNTDYYKYFNETRGGNTTVSEADPPPETSSLPASDPPEPPDPTPFDPYTASTPSDINDTWVVPNVTLYNATDQR